MILVGDLNSQKKWIEITLPVDDSIEEFISSYLMQIGAVGCQTQNQVLRGYFNADDWHEQKFLQFSQYLNQLSNAGFLLPFEKLEINEIKDRDWNTEWKKNYAPIEIGNKFIIKPSWIILDQKSSKEVIEIDPQMAFGTGSHATTQLVIQLFLAYGDAPQSILDIGTGTGILAIAAARFFESKIFVFDNDFTAAATARQNCIINGVAKQVDVFCCDQLNLKNKQFDLILANINRTVIINLLPQISSSLAPKGRVIFSGILSEEKEKIKENLNAHSLDFVVEKYQSEWVGIVAEKCLK